MSNGFSPTTAAFEGFRLIRREPLAVLVWCMLLGAYAAAMIIGMKWALGDEMISRASASGLEPAELWTFLGAFIGLVLLLTVFLTVGTAVLDNAVVRAVRGDRRERGFAYLRLSAAEGRLILARAVILCLPLAAWVGLVTFMFRADDLGLPISAAIPVWILICIVWVWVLVRLSLLAPAVMAGRGLGIGRAWAASRRRFWPLLGMWLLVFVMVYAVQIVVQAFAAPVMFIAASEMTAGSEPRDTMLAWVGSPWFLPLMALMVLVSALQLILPAAAAARAYRDITATPAAETEGAGAETP